MEQRLDRKPVYAALDAMPDAVFAVLVSAVLEMSKGLALVGLDDPARDEQLAAAIAPWLATPSEQPKERPDA